MEPEGRPLTPGTSYGPLDFTSAQSPPPATSACEDNPTTPEPPSSPKTHDDTMSTRQCWDSPEQTEGAEPGGSAQRRARSSAFHSSLSWDSDSEKETLDEEELLHLCNPHGLAAHSPGSPSTGLRLECEDSQEPEQVKALPTETDHSGQEEGQEKGTESTKTEEPNTSQTGTNHSADSAVWNVCERSEPFLSQSPPKESCQPVQLEEEADNTEGSKTHMGKESKKIPEKDVYTFPGDSDPESPPPAPWAHCTFIQRCRKKRVLLRPFSGLGSLKSRYSKERIYDFDNDELLEEEPKEHVEEDNSEMDNQIFTCVECSIYFKKQVHLQEHMVEHSQSTSEASQKENLSQFRCPECGWTLPNQNELEDHQRQHQESRDKILKEIEKLNEKDMKKQEALKLDPPVSNTDCAIVGLDTRLDRTPAQGRGLGGGYRRRFVCAVCNFCTRTSQALSNHVKTHNRKPTSNCHACKYCAFRTTSQNGLKEHLKVAHTGPEENGQHSTIAEGTDARSTGQVLTGNRRWNRKGKGSELEKLSGSEDGVEEVDVNIGQREGKTTHRTRSLSVTDDSLAHRSTVRTLPLRRSLRHEDKQDGEREGKVFFLRRSSRVTAITVDSDDEEGEGDEERTRRLLSEAVPDEDTEEIDEDAEALKSVERKCPYCPDRFHNGIGLANHVRGHLNRVGVSYNVRHFISPEEVNAIEKRFSYQKKRKKVANFDPGTFSVMHCEFCSAGFDTRAGLSSHARAHLRDLGITNWDVTISPIHLLREVFSSRPDLVIPTAPPRSPYDDEEELDTDEEEDEIIEVKLEGDSGERTEISVLGKSWKYEDLSRKCKDEEEEAADEEDSDALQLGALSSVPGKTGQLQNPDRSPREDAQNKANDLKCEVCGAQFETRRGLSSHARSHLRQLGIRGSESSGAPINFLYQIAKERNLDSQRTSTPPAGQKDEALKVMEVDKKLIPPSLLAKVAKAVPHVSSRCTTPSSGASPAPAHSSSPSSVVRKAPISSLLPVSSPLRSLEHKAGGIKTLNSNLNAVPTSKPLWAPQENDAPLNLTLEVDPNKDIVCQLCGAWFETRKGLSSHARAHLRHFGVEYSESKGSPIDLLNQLIQSDDFKHKANTLQLDGPTDTQGLSSALSSPKQPLLNLPSSSSPLLYKVTTSSGAATSKSTSASPLLGPPAKRLKPSSMQVFRLSSGELMALPHSEPPKEIGCEFCGEYFENRKGLSSHARSHLRQMGITQWSVNGSPIDTLREIIARRGLPCALPLKPLKTPPSSSPAPPPRSPRSPLSTSSSPPSALLSRLPFAFARRPSPPQMVVSKLNSSAHSSLTGLILKPKAEPVQLEVTSPGTVVRTGTYSTGGLSPTWTSSESVHPLNLAMAHEVEPTRDIRCEFCGEYFENRKGLSSHARSHLRQMGITQWSVNGSPIDTLREVMRKRGMGSASSLEPVVKNEVSSPSWDSPRGTTLEGVSTFQSSSLRKSPLSLLQSGLRIHKIGGLSSMATSAVVSSGGRFFRMSPLGKRPLSEEGASMDIAHSPPSHLKTYSPLPHDLSFKNKSPPVKHRPDPSCELCGFYFENRKALASHARAHLRQFGVTEWSVNGSPIETLSAWIRSRPQKVLDMHRSYMQGSRSPLKKKCRSPLSVSADPHLVLPVPSQKASSSSSSSNWSSSLTVSLPRPVNHEVVPCSSKTSEDEFTPSLDTTPTRPVHPSPSRLSGSLPLQAQVARSELNVRLPRGMSACSIWSSKPGFERRPLKHPSCPDGAERDSSSPRPLRTGTVPALVPKPPSYPLVKLEGNFYTLKCRFCEVEFHGPLSVQEDWIRHLQQHILKMNYKKPAAPKAAAVTPKDASTSADTSAPVQTSASTSTSIPSTPARTSSPPQPPTLTSSPPKPPARTSSPPQPAALISSPPQPSARISSPPQTPARTPSPPQPPTLTSSPPQPPARTSSPPQPPTHTASPPPAPPAKCGLTNTATELDTISKEQSTVVTPTPV